MAFSSFHFQSPKVKIQAKAVSPHRSLHFLHGARLYWAPARHTWTHFAIPRGARIIPKQFHLFYFSNINAQPNWKPPPPPLPKNGRSARGEKTHKDLSDGNAILIATRALQTPAPSGRKKTKSFSWTPFPIFRSFFCFYSLMEANRYVACGAKPWNVLNLFQLNVGICQTFQLLNSCIWTENSRKRILHLCVRFLSFRINCLNSN